MADLTRMQGCLLEIAVLNVLDDESTHGFEVASRLATFPRLVVSDSAVFSLLNRLCRDGLVAATPAQSSNDPAQQVYKLTPTGRRELWAMNEAWNEVAGAVGRLTARDRTFG